MRCRYGTIEFGETDIHLRTLRDTNECADPEGPAGSIGIDAQWSVFGVVWSSSLVLAAMMIDADIIGRRILEVGCGIGLASMVLNQRGADITATDRHPEVEGFLAHNVTLNGAPEIPFERSDWTDGEDDLGRFDLIIGSDLLYEREQAAALSRFVASHAEPRHEMILIDPGRGQAGAFARDMVERGFTHAKRLAKDDASQRYGREIGVRVQVHSFVRG